MEFGKYNEMYKDYLEKRLQEENERTSKIENTFNEKNISPIGLHESFAFFEKNKEYYKKYPVEELILDIVQFINSELRISLIELSLQKDLFNIIKKIKESNSEENDELKKIANSLINKYDFLPMQYKV